MREKSIETLAEASLLYDFYGELLTERQREVMELYHEENLSINEIAEEFEISKQAVHDTLKKAEKLLTTYEEKLGLMKRLLESREIIQEVDSKLDELIEKSSSKEEAKRLQELKDIVGKLEE